MSTHDAERMITVAELLRREGVAAGDGAGKGMKAAVATRGGGVVWRDGHGDACACPNAVDVVLPE